MSALLVLCSQVSAVTVHTWRDSSGVTHFSDEPSPQGQASSTLEFEGLNKAITAEEDDFYSIANQWKRMKAERDAASSRKLEKQKLKAAERERIAAIELQASRQAESRSESYVPTFPIYGSYGANFRAGRGGNHYQPGNGLPSFGRQARHIGRHDNRPSDYHSPFHDRSQPQSIRPKSSRRSSIPRGTASGRGRSHAQGSLFVQF